jgi:hypothetical protein
MASDIIDLNRKNKELQDELDALVKPGQLYVSKLELENALEALSDGDAQSARHVLEIMLSATEEK